MPQIHEFSAPEGLGLKPSNLGTDATAQAARRVTSLYSETAESQKDTGARLGKGIAAAGEAADLVAAHMEISHGSQGFSSMMAAKTKEWEDISKNADPNDPTVAQKFLEQNLEPELEKFKSGGFLTEKGQQWAEHHVESFRQHMYNKTAADMSSLAGQALRENHEKTVNNLSNSVWNDPSESNLKFALGTLKSSTDGVVDTSPNLRGVDAGKARSGLMLHGNEAIVKSAAMSHITKTGQMPDWVSDPKYSPYIKPDEMRLFQKQAQEQQKRDLYYQKATQQYEKAQLVEKSHAELSKNWTDNVSFDDKGRATIKPDYFKNITDIEMRYPGVATPRAQSEINWGQHQLQVKKETIITDGQTRSDLYDGVLAGTKSRVDILKASNLDKIDDKDTQKLLNLDTALSEQHMKNPRLSAALDAVKEKLGVNVVGDGHARYSNFMNDFTPQYLKAQRDGTLKPDDLDTSKPESLISKSLGPPPTPTQMLEGRMLKRYGLGGGDIGDILKIGAPGDSAPTPAAARNGVPPPDKLENGKVYDTPKGKLKWNATKSRWETP